MMVRYVGDLTDPKNGKEREVAAIRLEDVANAIRDRRVKSMSLSWSRDVWQPGAPQLADPEWDVEIEIHKKEAHER